MQRQHTDHVYYTIAKCQGAVDWEKIPKIPIDQVLWTDDFGIRAYGQLCHDEEHLYVHMVAIEKNIRAEYTEPLSPVSNDSCLEFFFMIDGEENYFNFEINPNGCTTIQFGRRERLDLVKENSREYFGISTEKTPDGWEAFYRIPLSFIRLFYPDYNFDRDILANMYKCGNLTANKHFIAWSPIDNKTPNFHMPEYFRRISY